MIFPSHNDFIEQAQSFHGKASPGLMIGSFMVKLAIHSIGHTERYHALCETAWSLPDAVQLLTSCTMGNGRLHIYELGRFALALYRIDSGKGVRVFIDIAKTEHWPAIRRWMLHEEISSDRERVLLDKEILRAGISILSTSSVQIETSLLHHPVYESHAVCISCGEVYPQRTGVRCRACQGYSPYKDRLIEEFSSEQCSS
jgi:formylmethanofuran dehydrogenase subunit E